MSLDILSSFADRLDWANAEGSVSFNGVPKPLDFPADNLNSVRLAATDPTLQRLSRALEAAEHSDGEFAGTYAEAIRFSILTRLLEAQGEARSDLQDPPAEPSCRPKTGLPKWRLKRVSTFVDEHLSETVTLSDMAAASGLSRMHFAAQFRATTGMRPHEFLLRCRIERAQEMLTETSTSLVEIALSVGFQTQAHFTTVFRRFVGDTPYQWRCANRANHVVACNS
ncbi:AraC family transcriptional regulator [Xanthobacter sp. DSM 24535]|uniref:helix-turn-helix domain-containing protein n=1 Tax=Roseixanthobacter psychrophilus TaxID=3119917 RepID=UPI0037287698